MTALTYHVRLEPARHEIEVELTLEGASGEVRLESPTWVPGDYDFAPFGRDVFSVRAAGQAVRRVAWQGYLVEDAGSPLRVSYTASCSSWEASEACGILGDRNGVLLGTRYLRVPAHTGVLRVTYEPPDGWEILHPSGATQVDERTWKYASYELLLDTPVVFGAVDRLVRDVHGTPFHCVFMDRGIGSATEAEPFADQLAAVAATYHGQFGSFPFDDYVFICSLNAAADWGLEHLTGTMVGLDPDVFTDPTAHATGVRACAHELFHAWNVRRLRPAPLGELDLERGSFTEGLWLAEGFTRYYEFLTLTRTGVYSPAQFFSAIVNYYRHLAALPAYERVSPIDASLATFLNHDDPYPGRVNNAIDYYASGMLIAFGVDAVLRPQSSLDALFAAFYDAFAGRGEGYTTADVRGFFDAARPGLGTAVVRAAGTPAALEVEAHLERIGFAVDHETVPIAGLVLQGGTGPAIYGVLDTSPAAAAGLAAEDVLTAIDDAPFDPAGLAWAITRRPAVDVRVLRGNETLEYTVAPEPRSRIGGLTWNGDAAQASTITGWLRREFAPAAGEAFPLDFYENFHGIETVI